MDGVQLGARSEQTKEAEPVVMGAGQEGTEQLEQDRHERDSMG